MVDMVPGLVSTIIPVHNRPEMLRQAIESVLGQTWRPIEIIIADDGSTDSTTELGKKYEWASKIDVMSRRKVVDDTGNVAAPLVLGPAAFGVHRRELIRDRAPREDLRVPDDLRDPGDGMGGDDPVETDRRSCGVCEVERGAGGTDSQWIRSGQRSGRGFRIVTSG